MKTELKASGRIVIKAETELESYALYQWSSENSALTPNMKIDSKFDIDASEASIYELQK